MKSIKLVAKAGSNIREDFLRKRIDLNCYRNRVKRELYVFSALFSLLHLRLKFLKSIEIDFFMCAQRLKDTIDNWMVFLGDQGLEKTAGILAETSVMLQQKTTFTDIGTCKRFFCGRNLAINFIKKRLECQVNGNERELFRALENGGTIEKTKGRE